MDYIGIWTFHSTGTFNDDGETVYMSPQEYLDCPMDYIDISDEEAVKSEMKERRQLIGSMLKIAEDNKMYMLMPLPEGVSDEEIEKAVDAGAITPVDGMLANSPVSYEIRDGQFWCAFDSGSDDEYVRLSDDEGFLSVMITRYIKVN